MSERSFDVIVIGSGIGGLTAALTVASRGRSVLVLEAGKQFGGYTNPFKRGPYSFDPGLHYLGECGPGEVLTRILEELGLGEQVTFRELSPGGFDRLVFPGYEVTMPRGAEAYHALLARDFPHERAGLAGFFAELALFHEAVRALAEASDPSMFFKATAHTSFLAKYLRATLQELLAPLIGDPLLKAVLAGQAGDYGLPPSRASALIGLGVLDHYLGGAYFPRGGSRALRDGFVEAIQARGGVMERGRPVARILLEHGRAVGVRCDDGEEHRAPTVISNADAVVTYRDLVGEPNLSARILRKTQAIRHSVSSLCLFLGTDLDLAAAGMTDANIWCHPTMDIEEAYAPIFGGAMPAEGFFFLSSPTLKDPESTDKAPPGHHTLELVTLVPFEPFARWAGTKTMRRGPEYEALKGEIGARYLEGIARFVPGIQGRVRVMEVSTPVTNLVYAGAPRGAIYGPEHTPDQVGPFRFQVKGLIPGLYLCGASTLGAGVVPGAMSGYAAGKLAVAEKGRRSL